MMRNYDATDPPRGILEVCVAPHAGQFGRFCSNSDHSNILDIVDIWKHWKLKNYVQKIFQAFLSEKTPFSVSSHRVSWFSIIFLNLLFLLELANNSSDMPWVKPNNASHFQTFIAVVFIFNSIYGRIFDIHYSPFGVLNWMPLKLGKTSFLINTITIPVISCISPSSGHFLLFFLEYAIKTYW